MRKTMILIEIVNTLNRSGSDGKSNYRYKVMVNDQVIEAGLLIGHSASDGWRKLVEMMIKEQIKDDEEG